MKLVQFLLFLFIGLSAFAFSKNDADEKESINEQGITEHITPENLITWIFEDGTFIPMAKLLGEKSYSIITDHLGTPVESYDEEGEKVWSRELNIYGETRKGVLYQLLN